MSLNSQLVDTAAYGSDEWVAARRRGIGASEMAAIAGMDPWKGEYALALEKRGESEPFAGNAATRWGHRIEGLALDAYSEMTGRSPIIRGETWTDRRWPHCWATLDGRWERIGIEVKATTRWNDPPRHVRVQCLAQMGLADLQAVDVVRVSPYGEPIITTIERDEQAITDLLDLCEEWYLRYVKGGEMPPPDGSRESMRHLDTLRGEEAAVATEEQRSLMSQLRHIRRRMEQEQADERRLIAALKASMAGTGSLTGPGFKVTWSAVKPRQVIDWQAVAKALADVVPEEDYTQLVTYHTSVGEGTTRFVPQWLDEEEPA